MQGIPQEAALTMYAGLAQKFTGIKDPNLALMELMKSDTLLARYITIAASADDQLNKAVARTVQWGWDDTKSVPYLKRYEDRLEKAQAKLDDLQDRLTETAGEK